MEMMRQKTLKQPPIKWQAEQLVKWIEGRPSDLEHPFTHAEIAEVINVPAQTTEYYQVVTRSRRMLLSKFGIQLLTARGAGYYLPSGDEQLEEMTRQCKLGTRRIKYGAKVGEAIKDDRLDETGRKRRDHMTGRIRYLAAIAKTETKALTAHVGMPKVLPQPKMPKT